MLDFDCFVFEKGSELAKLETLRTHVSKFLSAAAASRAEDELQRREKELRAAAFQPNAIGLREYAKATRRMRAAFDRGLHQKRAAQRAYLDFLAAMESSLRSLQDGTESLDNQLENVEIAFENDFEEQTKVYGEMVEAANKLHLLTRTVPADGDAASTSLLTSLDAAADADDVSSNEDDSTSEHCVNVREGEVSSAAKINTTTTTTTTTNKQFCTYVSTPPPLLPVFRFHSNAMFTATY